MGKYKRLSRAEKFRRLSIANSKRAIRKHGSQDADTESSSSEDEITPNEARVPRADAVPRADNNVAATTSDKDDDSGKS